MRSISNSSGADLPGRNPFGRNLPGRNLPGRALSGGILAAVLALAAAGCSTGGDLASTRAAAADDAYASTYRAYPGAPTALVGATVFDGAGKRIENGTVLFSGGEVEAVGDSGLAIPAGYTRIDGGGKFVTPASSTFIRISATIPAPRSMRIRMGTRRPPRPRPRSGRNIRSGRRTPASAARWPMAGSPASRSCLAPPI